jgi:hypothetical protein
LPPLPSFIFYFLPSVFPLHYSALCTLHSFLCIPLQSLNSTITTDDPPPLYVPLSPPMSTHEHALGGGHKRRETNIEATRKRRNAAWATKTA